MRLAKLKSIVLDWRSTLTAAMLAAVVVRLLQWRDYLATPLDQYTRIDTLDMKFLCAQAEAFLHQGATVTLHRLLCALSAPFTGGVLTTHGIVVAQMSLGVLTAGAVCLAALKLSGSRIAGLLAGLLAGCYAPALMYESFVMKESVTLFASALALLSFIAAGRGLSGFLLHGVAAAALPLARPAGILWALASTFWLSFRRRSMPFMIAPALAFATTLGAAFAFNYFLASSNVFFETNAHYNLQVASIPNAVSYNVSDASLKKLSFAELALKALANVPEKALAILNAHQAPDNVNYYFMKSVLPLLPWLPGPLLLIPLGLCGMAVGLWNSFKGHRRFCIPAAHFVLMAIPPCLFLVTGRYALFLVPSLAVAAGCLVHWTLETLWRKEWRTTGIFAILYCLLLLQAIPRDAFLRSDDFTGYGLATEMKYGVCQQSGECFAKALELNPQSPGAAINLSKWFIDARRPADAVELLEQFRDMYPQNFSILVNYSISLGMMGRKADAERELLSFGEPVDATQKAKWAKLLQMSK